MEICIIQKFVKSVTMSLGGITYTFKKCQTKNRK